MIQLVEKIAAGGRLSRREAEAVMEELLGGRLGTPDIVRLLEGLRHREETVEELVGFAAAMRRHARSVFADGERPENLVDTCGTGGDGSGTFNISTAAALVAAAAGARVAKHGNRSVSSRSGSADVLEALGARIEIPLERSGAAIREIGFGFLFAPAAHAATRHAMPARRQLGGRTIFNLLGPLTNPAGAQAQVLGVFSEQVLEPMARALAELGARRAFVVHGAGGLDEISLCGETRVAEVREGAVRTHAVSPEDFGVARAPMEALGGGDAAANAALIRRIFEGEAGARRDIVTANAAAALVAAGAAGDFREAARLAAQAIDSGAARGKLGEFVAFTNLPIP